MNSTLNQMEYKTSTATINTIAETEYRVLKTKKYQINSNDFYI